MHAAASDICIESTVLLPCPQPAKMLGWGRGGGGQSTTLSQSGFAIWKLYFLKNLLKDKEHKKCQDEHFPALKVLLKSMSDYLKALHAESACTLGTRSDANLLKTPDSVASPFFAVWQAASRTSKELICSVLTLQLKERPRLDFCTKKKGIAEKGKKKKHSWKRHTTPRDQGRIHDFRLEKLSEFHVGVFENG